MQTKIVEVLKNEFESRSSRNPSYSLRAFSRDLGISAATISQVLNEKRHLSNKNMQKVAQKLNLSPVEIHDLKWSTPGQGLNIIEAQQERGKLHLQEDQFRLISEWYYLAILNLTNVKNNSSDPKWIADRLGLHFLTVTNAIERLSRLGLLKSEKGRLVRTAKPIETTNDIPSSAIRNFHKQILDLAKLSIEIDPIEEREISSAVFAIQTDKLVLAKNIIRKFKDDLKKVISKSGSDRVYALSIQLFPISKKETGGFK